MAQKLIFRSIFELIISITP